MTANPEGLLTRTVENAGIPGRTVRTATTALVAIAAARLALSVAFAGRYDYFRDELYYLACTDHLAWGYVDHPPLSIAILFVTRHLLGDSLYAIRFPAALAGAGTVLLTGLMARRLGGGTTAQVVAALAAALSPIVLALGGGIFSMNAFDLLAWAAGSSVLLAILLGGSEKWWIAFGAIAGLGTINKYSMLFFGAGAAAGLLLTRERRHLARPWIWIGGVIAAAIVAPHAAWEIGNGFPTAEFIHNATALKNVAMPPATFVSQQILLVGIGQVALALAGVALFAFGDGRPALRVFAWAFLVVLAIMLASHSKPYYLAPAYFPYLAAGAVALERLPGPFRRVAPPVVAAVVIAFGAVAMPMAIPVLPVDAFVRYQHALGLAPAAEEHNELGDLPQGYADQFGWEDMVAKVAAVYRSLTPDEQRHVVIYARNYGEAGAIDFFGRKYGLPHAVCAHNSYWYWGTGVEPATTMIVFGAFRDVDRSWADLRPHFDEVTLAATTACAHCMPYENHRGIFLGRGPHFALRKIWPKEKSFI